MPQLRQDRTTKEWVIIAAERAKRPSDFKKVELKVERPVYERDCPIPDTYWSSLLVASSHTLKISNRSPSEALESGLPMAVHTTMR